MINQNNYIIECTNNDDAECMSSLLNVAGTNVSEEHVPNINDNLSVHNIIDVSNDSLISSLAEFIIVHNTSHAEKEALMHQTSPVKDTRSGGMQQGNAFAGGDITSVVRLSPADTREKANLRFIQLQEEPLGSGNAVTVETLNPKVGGTPSVSNQLYCEICPYQTNNELQLSSHLKGHAVAVVSYSCNMCSYVTDSRDNLILHFSTHAGQQYPSDSQTSSSKENLNQHLLIHFAQEPSAGGETNRPHQSGTQCVNRNTYICAVCNKEFRRKDHLIQHLRTHSGEKPFVCEVCDKRFTRNDSLALHSRLHTGIKPYACEFCGDVYARRDGLCNHLKTHIGEPSFPPGGCDDAPPAEGDGKPQGLQKTYACELCNKQFNRKDTLTLHSRTHTGVKPFICDTCDKAFPRRDNLIIHLNTHRKTVTYAEERQPRSRTKVPKKLFICPFCKKTFCRKGYLTLHSMSVHAGAKPHRCNICTKKFLKKSDLKRHSWVHSDVKQYPCEICDKSFSRKTSLANHLSKHS